MHRQDRLAHNHRANFDAWEMGVKAYRRGEVPSDCPLQDDTLAMHWQQGFQDAMSLGEPEDEDAEDEEDDEIEEGDGGAD